ncbi:MAG: hypothetical protein JRM74_04715 [Nitrososphaerota archaeon]|nr:hypothetical protein [Nitrososphaerota archaeon]
MSGTKVHDRSGTRTLAALAALALMVLTAFTSSPVLTASASSVTVATCTSMIPGTPQPTQSFTYTGTGSADYNYPVTSTPPTTGTGQYGPGNASQLLDESTGGTPDSLDPAAAFYTQDTGYLNGVFQNLVMYNVSSGTEVMPVLADQYWITNGGCTNVFHIRQGATFSDGTPVTGYDQWFSIVRTQYLNAPSGVSFINWGGVSYNTTSGSIAGSGYYSFSLGAQLPWGLRLAIQSVTGLQTGNDTQASVNLAVRVIDQMLSNFNPSNSTQAAIMQYPEQGYVANATYFTANYLRTLGPFGPQLWAGFDGQQVIEPAFVDAHGGVANNTMNSYINTNGAIGTGPYKISSVGPNLSPIVLVATPNYWAGQSAATNIPAVARPASVNTVVMSPWTNGSQAVGDFGSNTAQISAESASNYSSMYDALPTSVKSTFSFNQILRPIGTFDFAFFIQFNQYQSPTNFTSFRRGVASAINYTALNQPNLFNGTYYAGEYVGPTTPAYLYYNLPGYPNPVQNTAAAAQSFQEFGTQSHTYMVLPSSLTLSNGTTLAGGTVLGDHSGTQLPPFNVTYVAPLTGTLETDFTAIQHDLAVFGIDAVLNGVNSSEFGTLDSNPVTFPAFQFVGWGADFNDPLLSIYFPLMTPSPFNGFFDNATVNSYAVSCEFPATASAAQTCANNLEVMAYQNQIWIYTPIPEVPVGQPNAGFPTNFYFLQPYVQGWNNNQFVGGFYNQVYYAPVTVSGTTSGSGGGYTLTTATNSSLYSGSQTIGVDGSVTPAPPSGTSVSLDVFNPQGTQVRATTAAVNSAGQYNTSFAAGGSNWVSGTYVLKATWSPSLTGTVITATTTFQYLPTLVTTTSVSCSPDPITAGSPVTCDASVSGSGSVTGSLTWQSNSTSGSFSSTTCTLSGGSCSVEYTGTSAGVVNITASYSGNEGPSSGSFFLKLVPLNQAFIVPVTPTVDTLFVGQVLNFTYSSNIGVVETGIVWFQVENTAGQSVAVSGTSLTLNPLGTGSVYLSVSTLPAGTYTVSSFVTTLSGVVISPTTTFTVTT